MKLRLQFAALVVCFVVASGCTRDFRSNDLQFDAEKWKSGDLRTRGRMTKDLLDRKLLYSRSPSEVRELLGEPYNIDNRRGFEYETDPGAWLRGANNGPWIHWLHIEFRETDNRAGKVYIAD